MSKLSEKHKSEILKNSKGWTGPQLAAFYKVNIQAIYDLRNRSKKKDVVTVKPIVNGSMVTIGKPEKFTELPKFTRAVQYPEIHTAIKELPKGMFRIVNLQMPIAKTVKNSVQTHINRGNKEKKGREDVIKIELISDKCLKVYRIQ